jgi:hypothetical protein
MTIDYATWPDDLIPVRWDFFRQHNTTQFTSPITRSTQVLQRQGELWLATGTWMLEREESQQMDALLEMLKGAAIAIDMWDFSRPDPAGSNLGGTVEVNGTANAGDTTLNSEGWTISQSGVLLAGDLIGIDGYLYRVSQDVDSNGSGIAALSLTSPLRSDVGGSPGSVITRTKPKVSMRLIDDSQSRRSYEGLTRVNTYTLSFVEEW